MVRIESNGKYWVGAWRDAAGVLHRESLGAKAKLTKSGARLKAMNLAVKLSQIPAGLAIGHNPTLVEWYDRVIASKSRLSPATIKDLGFTRALVVEHFGESIDLGNVSPEHITQFRVWLEHRPVTQRRGGYTRNLNKLASVNTIRKHLRNLRMVFERAVRQHVLAHNPCLHEACSPTKTEKTWREIGKQEIESMLEACNSPGVRVMVGIARYAGLRLGEILRLTWADVDWGDLTFLVRIPTNARGEQLRTTKHRQRRVPIDPLLMPILREAQEACPAGETRVAYGNGEDSRERWAQRSIRGVCRRSGINYSKAFHTLRKCRESEWMAILPVLTVSEWMGHNAAVAQQHYTRAPKEHFKIASGASAETKSEILIKKLQARIEELENSHNAHPQTSQNPA